MLRSDLLEGSVLPILGHGLTAVVLAAARTGLLREVEEPITAEDLAAVLDLDLRATKLVLAVLCAIGHVTERDGVYRRPNHLDHMRDPWPRLEGFLRDGEPTPHIDRPGGRGPAYSRTVIALGAIFAEGARELAEKLSDAERIVDVGAGSSIWSLSMAKRSIASHVLAVDLPEVALCAREQAASMGMGDRVSIHAGDYFEVELPEPADRIVLANVLHLESEENAARLVARYAAQLDVGGELVIIDSMGGGGFSSRLIHHLHDLHLGMRTAVGKSYTAEQLKDWCSAAGLEQQRIITLESAGGFGALVASRGSVDENERDVTTLPTVELESMREELETARARLYQVFEGATDAMMVVRKSSQKIISMNSAFRALLHVDWRPGQLHDLSELFPEREVERFRTLFSDLVSGRVDERRHRFTLLRNGTPMSAELTAFDPRYRTSISFIVRDSDRMARQARLRAIGELASGVCHDLNTPLASLKSNMDLIQRMAARLDGDPRLHAALGRSATDAEGALAIISERLATLGEFATLEGEALTELAPSFTSGLARAICEKTAGE